MSEIERATLAIMIVDELLAINKKILAIKIIRFMYQANLPHTKQFVDRVQMRLPVIK